MVLTKSITKGVIVMRWIPLIIILFIAIASGLYLFETVTDFEKRRFYLVSLV